MFTKSDIQTGRQVYPRVKSINSGAGTTTEVLPANADRVGVTVSTTNMAAMTGGTGMYVGVLIDGTFRPILAFCYGLSFDGLWIDRHGQLVTLPICVVSTAGNMAVQVTEYVIQPESGG